MPAGRRTPTRLASAERDVALTARQAGWDADPPNSLAALESCLRAPVARVAVDLHVMTAWDSSPAAASCRRRSTTARRLRDIVALVIAVPGPDDGRVGLIGGAAHVGPN